MIHKIKQHSIIYIITLIARMFTRLMRVFNMFTQMMHSTCFLITLIALLCNQLMSVFNMFTQMTDLICLFITIIVLSVMDQNVFEKWIFVIMFFTFMCQVSYLWSKVLCSSVTTHKVSVQMLEFQYYHFCQNLNSLVYLLQLDYICHILLLLSILIIYFVFWIFTLVCFRITSWNIFIRSGEFKLEV